MKEQFIPYELALKLKELGFDDKSLGFSYMRFNCEGVSNATFEKVVPNYLYNSYDLICTAPLWQQAFDWFLDKYKYWQFTFPNIHTKYWSYHIQYYDVNNCWGETFIKGGFKNQEQARLFCLEKLIEIVETKKDSV